MNRFIALLKLEYDRIFLPLLINISAMAVIQVLLFSLGWQEAQRGVPLSYLISSSGIPIVFAIGFGSLLALIGVSIAKNYMPSKSIYALLTLPIKRSHVYLTKLTAILLAGFVFIAAQMVLLLIFSGITAYASAAFGAQTSFDAARRQADLYLALLDVRFLRMIFPPDLFSLAFSILGVVGTFCVALYVGVMAAAGKRGFGIEAVAAWVLLLIYTFPISDYSRANNTVTLGLMLWVSLVVTIRGVRLFNSGGAAK